MKKEKYENEIDSLIETKKQSIVKEIADLTGKLANLSKDVGNDNFDLSTARELQAQFNEAVNELSLVGQLVRAKRMR